MKIVVSQYYTMIILEKMRHDTILEMVKNYYESMILYREKVTQIGRRK